MLTSGFVFTTPTQFGPTTRMPFRRARWTSACLRVLLADLGEPARDEDQPAETLLGALSQDGLDRADRDRDDGEVDRARESRRRSDSVSTPSIDVAFGFTGYTGPAKPPASRFRRTA